MLSCDTGVGFQTDYLECHSSAGGMDEEAQGPDIAAVVVYSGFVDHLVGRGHGAHCSLSAMHVFGMDRCRFELSLERPLVHHHLSAAMLP